MLNGKPVLQHTLDAVRASGLPWHLEDAGHPGMGDSIAAAVRATPDANGWLILPGDLPMVSPATLRAVADGLKTAEVVVPLYTVTTGAEPERGHPVGFSRACHTALLALRGEAGAAKVVKSYRVHSLQLNDPGMLADVDMLDDLERLAKQLQSCKSAPFTGAE